MPGCMQPGQQAMMPGGNMSQNIFDRPISNDSWCGQSSMLALST